MPESRCRHARRCVRASLAIVRIRFCALRSCIALALEERMSLRRLCCMSSDFFVLFTMSCSFDSSSWSTLSALGSPRFPRASTLSASIFPRMSPVVIADPSPGSLLYGRPSRQNLELFGSPGRSVQSCTPTSGPSRPRSVSRVTPLGRIPPASCCGPVPRCWNPRDAPCSSPLALPSSPPPSFSAAASSAPSSIWRAIWAGVRP
mmetsp:Transcript_50538/g.120272  ORF Transcript_50538/g.120272 Transcript_50538/m.120272 type:complete len:204 (+) Transcript_50538:121-732(+)